MKTETMEMVRPAKTLPLPVAESGSAGMTALTPSESLRILLVEDSPPDVAMIKHILRSAGRKMSVVHVDTREAFEAELNQRPPDLILSDYALPTFDGGRALEIAQQIAPQVPFIFVTGTL